MLHLSTLYSSYLRYIKVSPSIQAFISSMQQLSALSSSYQLYVTVMSHFRQLSVTVISTMQQLLTPCNRCQPYLTMINTIWQLLDLCDIDQQLRKNKHFLYGMNYTEAYITVPLSYLVLFCFVTYTFRKTWFLDFFLYQFLLQEILICHENRNIDLLIFLKWFPLVIFRYPET